MKKVVKKIVIDSILESLLNNNFDWNSVQLSLRYTGCFTRQSDVRDAYLRAKIMLDGIKDRVRRNDSSIPKKPEEIEGFLVMHVAEQSFTEGLNKLNNPFFITKRNSIIIEMKDDLNDMRELGLKDEVSIYSRLMKEKIGT